MSFLLSDMQRLGGRLAAIAFRGLEAAL